MTKKVFYAFGFAIWLLASNLVEAFFSSGVPTYHSQLATPPVFIALLLDFAIVICVSALLYARLRAKSPGWVSPAVLAALIPGLVLIFNRMLIATLWLKIIRGVGLGALSRTATSDMVLPVPFKLAFALWAVWALLIFALTRWRYGQHVCRVAVKIFLIAGAVLGLSLMLNLVRGAVRRSADTKLAAFHPQPDLDSGERPRLVWLVMDELSYDKVFEHRDADLQLPVFDKLRAQSTVYSHTLPVSYWTDLALPSLMIGQEVVELHFTYMDKLSFRYASDNHWSKFDPQQTVFGDAERAGWNVSVAGWWNPYCAIYSGMLQKCFWTFNEAYAPMRAYKSVGANMERSLVNGLHVWNDPPFLRVRLNENSVVLQHAMDDINDNRIDFVFIHVGVPHFPYPFNRHTGMQETKAGHSYLDGLAYADAVLGGLMNELQKTPRWKNTTLILNGDHSWRTEVWRVKPGWTAEDERVSGGGKFDDRPMLIVHAPGQSDGVTVTEPTPLLHVHDMIQSVLKTGKPGQ